MDSLPAQAAAAAQSGVSLIQIREAGLEGGALFALVRRCVEAVRGTPARVIVNDRLDVALSAGAHGVHLRHDGVDPARVRAAVSRPFLIGRSIHSVQEAREADASVLDYVIFGTVFETASKPGRIAAGLEALREVVAATRVPVLAIGGITSATSGHIAATGAAGVAAIGTFVTTPEALRASTQALSLGFDTATRRSLP